MIVETLKPIDTIRIDAPYSGVIHCETLYITKTGSVEGIVVARKIVLHGAMSGVIDCETLQVHKGAAVDGTIFSPDIQHISDDLTGQDWLDEIGATIIPRRYPLLSRQAAVPHYDVELMINRAVEKSVSDLRTAGIIPSIAAPSPDVASNETVGASVEAHAANSCAMPSPSDVVIANVTLDDLDMLMQPGQGVCRH